MKSVNWKTYCFEFFSILIAVITAFALNNWNENRHDREAENKILSEIANGLSKDIEDVDVNMRGHRAGIRGCKFWRGLITGKDTAVDSLSHHYMTMTRDFVSVQNTSGYETLKSRGLELIQNDALRLRIIALYEYDYNTLRKLEEEYQELQFHHTHFATLNAHIAPNLEFDARGNITGLTRPLTYPEATRNLLLSQLWKIQANRTFVLGMYDDVKEKIMALEADILDEVAD